MAGDAFVRALDAEVKQVYKDVIEHTSRMLFFDGFPKQDPVLGPPRPPWWEIELAGILAEDGEYAVQQFLPDIARLIERVDDQASDW